MRTVKDLCEEHYDSWINDCSIFLKAVAKDLGISLSGQANGIIDMMRRNPWTAHEDNVAAAVVAAGKRKLVVAGLKAKAHGHVVIILPGAFKPYPVAYWGSISKHPGRNKTINWAWSKHDLPSVEYFSCSIPSPIAVI